MKGSAAAADPRAVIDHGTMTWRQFMVIGLCVLLNGLDGFDVLSISFASPGISAEWGIDRAALGIILSMELIGMSVGSIALGLLADRIGRSPVVVGSLLVMAGGMALAAMANGILELGVIRLVTGLGIGGMLACTNAIVAEAASNRVRAAAVAVMAAGYPLGAIIGGSIASELLKDGSWRDIFWLGAGATIAFLPLVLLILPESIGLIVRRFDGQEALLRVNRALKRLGHATLSGIALAPRSDSGEDDATIMRGALRRTTLLLIAAYFFHMTTFYFILKWIPKIVVDMGFAASSAGGVLVWANVGGLVGSLVFSLITTRVPVRPLVMATFVIAFGTVVLFGMSESGLEPLARAAAIAGFFTNAAVVGLYALIASSYPAHLRAGATGVVIGFGRGGAALGPVLAGLLFAGGISLPLVAAIMGLGSLIALAAIAALPRGHGRA
ncbi:MAG: MFS transporter [Sphingomonadales bacterium]|nr:MFS transporter [Sphingomonadales bacterium]PIX66985.1 MAG: MFS transporter [Sphingomonadales bacterium CG_4_10_14_3_um_filter_58_15]NCO50415.1 MFS transporter [Sphingomonadales bacterium]NCP00762.1 MFS transporter [Sphingomonadales bacterium]NCP25492.1 MFS transporter [Sphingomonadales bacterium]